MRRAAALTSAVAVLLVTGAMGCSASDDATGADEAGRWMEERSRDEVVGLGAMSGRIRPADPEPSETDGVTVTFGASERVDGVRLSCLGGTVDFTIQVTTGTGSISFTVDSVACGTEEHEEPLDVPDATSVRVNGGGADREGAWHAVVLGGAAG